MLEAQRFTRSSSHTTRNGQPEIFPAGPELTLLATSEPASPPLRTGPIEVSSDEDSPSGTSPLPRWLPRYVGVLLTLDTLAMVLGGLLGRLLRSDKLGGMIEGVAYFEILLAATPLWLLAMATARAYEGRFLGIGSEEFRRVANAGARFTALLALALFFFQWEVARGLVVLALPSAVTFTLLFRYLARKVLHRVRRSGRASHRVLVVGEVPARDILTARLRKADYCGLHVVGVCRPVVTGPAGTPSVTHVRDMIEALRADTVAVAHSPLVDSALLRGLAWSLEGTGVNLLVAPALTDVAGPRVNIRPVSGLPLLQITEPEFAGVRRVLKDAIDVTLATVLLLVFGPLFAALTAAVRLSSSGPAFFRQVRIGRNGREFLMYKFRSMYRDAERELEELRSFNDHGEEIMFKMRNDPRVTRVGRFMRRFSLDELPQLINVLKGDMSLVGPRPPLPTEVALYPRHVHRRLLVKPGLTGLWQVSGRADLDWEETVRLDLYYVENWSVTLDLEIIWKTLWAVLRGSGAR
jgi:exopolysaccharide biosynthesis polyprenyl glycosylphosphotransferase